MSKATGFGVAAGQQVDFEVPVDDAAEGEVEVDVPLPPPPAPRRGRPVGGG